MDMASSRVNPKHGLYVQAKHAHMVEKNPEQAIALFEKAIKEGDRVDSALKDMAIVLKQLNRNEEAIQAINSFRLLCSENAQVSLDNILIDLYKKCGKVDEQIEILRVKLRMIYQGQAFNGKPTKTARSHGKKFQLSVQQELSRILGNLGWAYMQKMNYIAAEVVYRKAQMIDPDAHKACNLGPCLIKQGRFEEARCILEEIQRARLPRSEDVRDRNRAEELLLELASKERLPVLSNIMGLQLDDDYDFINGLDEFESRLGSIRSRRLPIFEQISNFKDQLAC